MRVRQPLFLSFKFLASRNTDKNLFRHIRGAVIGIALSLVPLVIVLEVTDGMIEGITRRYIETGSYHFQARDARELGADYEMLLEMIEKDRDVINAFTFIQETCLVYTGKGRTGVSVRGLPSDLYNKDKKFAEYIDFSKGGFELGNDSILLSAAVAEKTGASVGDEIKILTAYNQPGRPMILRPARFVVKGVFTTGYRQLDEITVFIEYGRAMTLFRGISQPYIGIKVRDPYGRIGEMEEAIRDILPPGFIVNSWYRLNMTLYKSLETTKKLLMFIMLLILCVASLNISSAMVMMVLSRRKEIAILKSIGFSRTDIAAAFILTGFIIGIAGTVSGMATGLFLAVHINLIIGGIENLLNIFMMAGHMLVNAFDNTGFNYFRILGSGYYLEEIPVVLDYAALFTVTAFSVFLAVAASFLPAYRAGAIRPVEIIRKS